MYMFLNIYFTTPGYHTLSEFNTSAANEVMMRASPSGQADVHFWQRPISPED